MSGGRHVQFLSTPTASKVILLKEGGGTIIWIFANFLIEGPSCNYTGFFQGYYYWTNYTGLISNCVIESPEEDFSVEQREDGSTHLPDFLKRLI